MTTPHTRTVLVLGANGRFGLAATQAFAGAGWRVLAQVRRDPGPAMPPSATIVRAPLAALAAGGALATLPRADVVVHAVNPLYTRWDEVLPAATRRRGARARSRWRRGSRPSRSSAAVASTRRAAPASRRRSC